MGRYIYMYAFFEYAWYYISSWWFCNVTKLIKKIKLYLSKIKLNVWRKYEKIIVDE